MVQVCLKLMPLGIITTSKGTKFLFFSLHGIFISDFTGVPAAKRLQSAMEKATLSLAMVDATNRYIDCYCIKLKK